MSRNPKSPAPAAEADPPDVAGADEPVVSSADTPEPGDPPPIPEPPPRAEPEWHYWTPNPRSGLDVAWAQLLPAQFRVQLAYAPSITQSVPSGGTAAASAILVDTVLDAQRPEVPFSVFEAGDPAPFLSGSFDFDAVPGVLSIQSLRYPGGRVAAHVLYPAEGD